MNRKFINLGGYIVDVVDHSTTGSVDKNLVTERYLDPPGIQNGKPIIVPFIDFKTSWEGS